MRRMRQREVRARVAGGELVGSVRGEGTPVLLLHGGPGLNGDYLEDLVTELGAGFETAWFQQRGLAPSTEKGPFDIATQVDDVRHMLDALDWETAYVVGHSWGGHLVVHVARAMPQRLRGVLAVDPLGAVGDGCQAEFDAEIFARTPAEVRARAQELDERAMAGEGSDADVLESMALVWPAYFADWDAAPPVPAFRASSTCYAETFASLLAELPALEAALPSITVPVGFVAGAHSPMPNAASTDTASRIPGAWAYVVPDAGHFPWVESPGTVRTALQRLMEQR
jgi:pimeloyl-ACP methyl ester carboxylesterase